MPGTFGAQIHVAFFKPLALHVLTYTVDRMLHLIFLDVDKGPGNALVGTPRLVGVRSKICMRSGLG